MNQLKIVVVPTNPQKKNGPMWQYGNLIIKKWEEQTDFLQMARWGHRPRNLKIINGNW